MEVAPENTCRLLSEIVVIRIACKDTVARAETYPGAEHVIVPDWSFGTARVTVVKDAVVLA